MTTEQVNEAFGKALDHVKATQSPRDGGLVEAAVEALRDAWSTNGEFAAKVTQQMNDKYAAVEAREAEIAKANEAEVGKQKGPSVEATANNNPAPTGGVQAGGASSGNTTGQANAGSAGGSGDVTGGSTGGAGSPGPVAGAQSGGG